MKKMNYKVTHTILFFLFFIIAIVPMGIVGFLGHARIAEDAQVIKASEGLRFSSDFLNELGDSDAAELYSSYEINYQNIGVLVTDFDGNVLFGTSEQDPSGKEYRNLALEGKEGFVVSDGSLVTYTSKGYLLMFTYQELSYVNSPADVYRREALGYGAFAAIVLMILSFIIAHHMTKHH